MDNRNIYIAQQIAENEEETIQFITLGNLDCGKVIYAVSQYIRFQRKSFEL